MVSKAVRIFIDRVELIGYTDMRLRRAKDEMTGELSFTVFMGYTPNEPLLYEATRGREVLVYIANHLAFSGFIDRRQDRSSKKRARDSKGRFVAGGSAAQMNSGDRSLSIGDNEYSIRFTCRGKTKYIIDSSHQHPTGTMLRPTSRSAAEELVAPFGVDVQWEAEPIELDKVRLRDGGMVSDELQRLAEQASLYLYETRQGALKVSDGSVVDIGEALVMGTNLLTFTADQAEDQERSEVVVKGQRIEKDTWGEPAVVPTIDKALDQTVSAFSPITVMLYGNATPDALKRRTQFEMNKRAQQAKRVECEVFHVQRTDGLPWDLGVLHYVEIPPAGVFDLMEVVELEYIVSAPGELKTRLVLSPAPATVANATVTAGDGFLGQVPEVDTLLSVARSRRSQLGVAGGASSWASPKISFVANPLAALAQLVSGAATAFLSAVERKDTKPPLELPPGYQSQDEVPND